MTLQNLLGNSYIIVNFNFIIHQSFYFTFLRLAYNLLYNILNLLMACPYPSFSFLEQFLGQIFIKSFLFNSTFYFL
jgi:hypothetical protein